MRLLKDLLAMVFYGLAEGFDRLAIACESKVKEVVVLHMTTTNGHSVATPTESEEPYERA